MTSAVGDLGPFMAADFDVPDRLSVATRIILWAVFAFIFALVGWEKLWERDFVAAGVNGVLLVIDTVVAVKWHWFAAKFRAVALRFGGRKVTIIYLALALLCAIGLGFAVGKLLGRTEAAIPTTIIAAAPSDTGRIAWNLDEAARGLNYFLGFNRQNQEEVRISGFVAHGKNTSADPITQFKGYMRSDITNEQWPIYLIAEDPNAKSVFDARIPTLPDETFGIPAGADFDITTFDKPIFQGGVDGIPLSKFMRDFASFTVVIEYDGITVRRQFTTKEIEAQIELFERQIDPRKANTPRVTRRPTATPPIQSTFHLPVPESKDIKSPQESH